MSPVLLAGLQAGLSGSPTDSFPPSHCPSVLLSLPSFLRPSVLPSPPLICLLPSFYLEATVILYFSLSVLLLHRCTQVFILSTGVVSIVQHVHPSCGGDSSAPSVRPRSSPSDAVPLLWLLGHAFFFLLSQRLSVPEIPGLPYLSVVWLLHSRLFSQR